MPVGAYLPLFSTFALLLCSSSLAHELEDDFVERTVQFVVRDRKATVTYSFGMSEKTTADFLSDLPGAGSDRNPPAKTKDSEKSQALTFEPDSTSADSTTTANNKLMLESLTKNFVVEVDGVPVQLDSKTISASPRHHFTYVASFEFVLPEAESVQLSVADKNFQKSDGAVRFALKTADKAFITRSNVAPIVIRATRHKLAELDAESRKKCCSFDATIAWSGHIAKD